MDTIPCDDSRALSASEVRRALSTAKVAVLGCGGLGSNVASMLVRAGVGSLVLVDFDRVEQDNLNRQLYFRDDLGKLKTEALSATLLRIDPAVSITSSNVVITPDELPHLVEGCDVIVEAVDGAETKAMIINACTEMFPDVPLVSASGLAGYSSANLIVSERLTESCYIVGDLTSDVREGTALLSSRVMAAAAHQAHVVIRVLLGCPEP